MRKLSYLLLSVLCLTSCARETSSDVYDSQNFGEAQTTYLGVIKRIREVTVTNGEGLQDNTTGVVGDGIAGGLLGSTIDHGAGSAVAEVVGGLAGATGDASLEQGLKTQKATEYLIELDNGTLKTVVQASEPKLFEGQRVYLMQAENGRSRVVAYKI